MQKISLGAFSYDPQRNLLMRDGERVPIGNKGMLLLQRLVACRGRTVSKQDLMDAVWPGIAVEESNLSVQIAALRKILGPSPGGAAWIVTVPRDGYRFIDDAGLNEPSTKSPTERPSIIVLPFLNASGDPDQDYLVDGITEDVIFALTRFRWFSVISRNSSFHFKSREANLKSIVGDIGISHVIEGSFRRDHSRVRIVARLIDAASGVHIWANRYDLAISDIFAIQDEIAERVAGAIEPELLRSMPVVSRHSGNIDAWDVVRQGTFRFHQLRRETHLEARELFRKAAMLDRHLPEAHLWIARANAGLVAYGWSEQPANDATEGRQSALQAIALDDRNPYAHYSLSIINVYSGSLDEAIRAAERAIEIAPSFALGHLVLGMAQLFSGHTAQAARALEYGLRLSPYDPQNFVWYNLLALASLFGGKPDKGREFAVKALQIRPGWKTTLEILVACNVGLKDWESAKECVRNLDGANYSTDDVLAPMRQRNHHWAAQLDRALDTARSLAQ